MAKYTINWTDDSLKDPFVVNENTADATKTSLIIKGKGLRNWGEINQENFLRLLENFASNNKPPLNATVGQLWFNADDHHLKFLNIDGSWVDFRSFRIDSSVEPHGELNAGDMWWDTTSNVLKVRNIDGGWETLGGIPTATPTPVVPTPIGQPTFPPTPITPPTTSPVPGIPTPQVPGPTPTPVGPVPTPVTPGTPDPFPFGVSASLVGPMTFREEFNGPGLNNELWHTKLDSQTTPVANYEISDSMLHIWPQQSGGSFFNRTFHTKDKFFQKYGFFEIEARLPVGKGIWPSFVLKSDAAQPTEIDFMEAFSGAAAPWASGSFHPVNYQSVAYGSDLTTLGIRTLGDNVTTPVDLSDGFHKYAMLWDQTGVQFFFDGQLLGKVDDLADTVIETTSLNQRMFVMLNLWFGSLSGTATTETTPQGIENALKIRYVRGWSLPNGTTQVEGTYPRYQPNSPTPGVAPTPTTSPTTSPTVAPTPAPGGPLVPFGNVGTYGAIAFNEEFNGTSLNTGTWNAGTDPAMPGTNPPTNFDLSNGALNIWPAVDQNGQFFSRILTTEGKFSQKYGYFEMEAKLPQGRGCWPAFWLYNKDDPNNHQEIDIIEAFCGGGSGLNWSTDIDPRKPNNFASNVWVKAYPEPTQNAGERRLAGTVVPMQPQSAWPDLSAGFHKYGCSWDASGVQFFFDGQPMGAKINTTAMNKSMYLLIDLYMHPSQAGTPDPENNTVTPKGKTNSFVINYIRAWPAVVTNPNPGGTPAPLPTPTPTQPPAPTPSLPQIIDYYGDSTIWGWKANADWVRVPTTAPQAMDAGLPSQWVVNNYGVNGGTAQEMLAGIDGHARAWSAQLDSSNAGYVIINYGLNDSYTNRGVTNYKADLTQMVQVAKTKGKRPILETPNPASYDISAYVTAMRQVATEQGVGLIDQYQMLIDRMASTGQSLWDLMPDGLHPSDNTYVVKGNYAAQRFLQLLGTTAAPTPAPTTAPTPAPTTSPTPSTSKQVRYIRNYINGNNINPYNHWVEIQAFNTSNTNVALGKSASVSALSQEYTEPPSVLTDGNTSSDPYINAAEGLQYAQVDLGQVYTLSSIRIWHYYADGRTYNGNRTDISTDGTNWQTVDSGSYQETSAGRTISMGGAVVPAPTTQSPTPVTQSPTPAPAGGSGSGPLGQNAADWVLTFEDHFNGSTLDRTKWTERGGPRILNSTPGTWKIENSNLVLCYQDPFQRGNVTIITDPAGNGIQGGFEQTYGYFEARIKLPYGRKMFPAFWLFRNDTREIDIMEVFGGEPAGQTWVNQNDRPINAAWTIHRDQATGDMSLATGTLAHDYWRQYPGTTPYSWLGVNVTDLSLDYHTFACRWEPSGLWFYMDGRPWRGQNGSNHPWTARIGEYNVAMYMMVDLWVDSHSDAGGTPRGYGPHEMRVDYVRAWRRR